MSSVTPEPVTSEPCTYCHGKGSVPEMVNWSDGWGMTARTCPVCDGSAVAQDLARELIAYKRQARELAEELRHLKTHVALYLSEVETGGPPNPPLADATRPGRGAQLWRDYLGKAIANLPRVAPSTTEVPA